MTDYVRCAVRHRCRRETRCKQVWLEGGRREGRIERLVLDRRLQPSVASQDGHDDEKVVLINNFFPIVEFSFLNFFVSKRL